MRHKFSIDYKTIAKLLIFLCTAFLFACSSDEEASDEKPEGFLNDYGSLEPVEGREGTWYYENDKADWKKYNRIVVEPVRIQTTSEQNSMSLRDRRMLGTYFEIAIHQN